MIALITIFDFRRDEKSRIVQFERKQSHRTEIFEEFLFQKHIFDEISAKCRS